MENPANTACVVCSQAEGKPCECVTVHRHVTAYKTRRKGNTQYKTSYSNVERHTGCVCDGCRKKQRAADLKRFAICLAVGSALLAVIVLVISASNARANRSGSSSMDVLGSLAALALIPDIIFVGWSLVWLIGGLRGDYGSQTLGAYYVKKHRELYPGDNEYIWMTPKKARSEHLID